MALDDLTFEVTPYGSSNRVFDPLQVTTAATVTVRIVNNNTADDLTGLGLYIIPARTLGDTAEPADFSPDEDFQYLLALGQASFSVPGSGGIKFTSIPVNNGGTLTDVYVRPGYGDTVLNKLPLRDIVASGSQHV